MAALLSGADALSVPPMIKSSTAPRATLTMSVAAWVAYPEYAAVKAQLEELQAANLKNAVELAELAKLTGPAAPPTEVVVDPAPVVAAATAMSQPVPVMDSPELIPDVVAATASPASSANPLFIDAAVIAGLPLVVFGISAFVGAITSRVSAAGVPSSTSPASHAIPRQPNADSRSAPTIFLEGLDNITKDPFGWLSFKPSALTSSLTTPAAGGMAPSATGGRQMGIQELARQQMQMDGVVTPTQIPSMRMPLRPVPQPMMTAPVAMAAPPAPIAAPVSPAPYGTEEAVEMATGVYLTPNERMVQLQELLQDGLVTEDEYEEARKQVFGESM